MTAHEPFARFPEGALLPASRPSAETLDLLARRRSAKWAQIRGPGPNEEELSQILAIASRVPDHGKLAPWRFIVIAGEARTQFIELLARRTAELEPGANAERLDFERARFGEVPVAVVIVSRASEHAKIPIWEQELSAGAVAMTMLIASSAMGYAAAWITRWHSYDPGIISALGLSSNERIAGVIGIGQADDAPERERPALKDLITHWNR